MGNKTNPVAIRVGTFGTTRDHLVDRSFQSHWSTRQVNQRGELTIRDHELRRRRKDWLLQSGYLVNRIHIYRSAFSVDVVAQIYRVAELNLLTDSFGEERVLMAEADAGIDWEEIQPEREERTEAELHTYLTGRLSRYVEHGKSVFLTLDLLNHYVSTSSSSGETEKEGSTGAVGVGAVGVPAEEWDGPFETDFRNILNLRFVAHLPVAPLRAQRLGYAISSGSRRESDIYSRVQQLRVKEFEQTLSSDQEGSVDQADSSKEEGLVKKLDGAEKARKVWSSREGRRVLSGWIRDRWKVAKLIRRSQKEAAELKRSRHLLRGRPGWKIYASGSDRVTRRKSGHSGSTSRIRAGLRRQKALLDAAQQAVIPSRQVFEDSLDPVRLETLLTGIESTGSEPTYVGGFLIEFKGRLNGSERKRVTQLRAGSLPRHRISADIDWGRSESYTTTGARSIKVQVHYTLTRPSQVITATNTREQDLDDALENPIDPSVREQRS